MMRKYLNLFLVVSCVLGLTSYAYAITVPGDCRSPNVCYACHTQISLLVLNLGAIEELGHRLVQ
jgi:hypothetical protein